MTKKILTVALAVIFSSVASAAEQDLASRRLADELEKAIFLHEGEANLAKAEEAYRSILEESQLVDAIAAEASYRLAVVYLDQGKENLAMKLLNDLIEEYPGEQLWIAEAEALLPAEFVPEFTPWSDGERLSYVWYLPTGEKYGRSCSTIFSLERGGRSLWRKENRFSMRDGERSTAVEFEKDSFRTVFGRLGFQAEKYAMAWYAEDGLSAKVEYEATGKTQVYTFDARVYDNEQAVDLIRQMPIEVGYKMEKKIFVSVSGLPIDITFEVKSINKTDTSIGTFDCYEVEIDILGQKQQITVTADERRLPVSFKVGGVEARISALERVDVEAFHTYRNEVHGFSLELPGSWAALLRDRSSDESDQVVSLAEPKVRGEYLFVSELNSDWKKTDPISVEGLNDVMESRILRRFPNLEVQKGDSLSVSGLEGRIFKYLPKAGETSKKRVYLYVLLGDEKHYFMRAILADDDVEQMLPVAERILNSLKLH